MRKNYITIKAFVTPPKDTNVYVIVCGGEAAVVDAADCCDVLRGSLKEVGATLKYVLLTHGHPSHVSSLSRMKKVMGGTTCVHPSDRDLLRQHEEGLEPDLLLVVRTLPRGDWLTSPKFAVNSDCRNEGSLDADSDRAFGVDLRVHCS